METTPHSVPPLRLLIVEDSLLIRQRLLDMIKPLDTIQIVGTAASSNEAIAAVAQTMPQAVLLDLKLAEDSGLSVLRHIKQCVPQTVVLVFTNYAMPYIRKACLDAGAAYFFDKSADTARLLQTLLYLSSPTCH